MLMVGGGRAGPFLQTTARPGTGSGSAGSAGSARQHTPMRSRTGFRTCSSQSTGREPSSEKPAGGLVRSDRLWPAEQGDSSGRPALT